MPRALVLGGAGFIGSNICHHLLANGFRVTVVDGLLPRTSGSSANLISDKGSMEFINQRVEDLHTLPDLLRGCDLVCWCRPLPCHGDVLLRLASE